MPYLHYSIIFFFIGMSSLAIAECSDLEAKIAADKAAQGYINGQAIANSVAKQSSEIFKKGLVLKKHLPSNRKEVASYIKTGDLYYTVFSLVDSECKAKAIKRTNGKY